MERGQAFARASQRLLESSGGGNGAVPPPPPPPEPEPGPREDPYNEVFSAIKQLITAIHLRLDKLEARKGAEKGTDGISVVDAVVDGSGDLVVSFSDGVVKNCGHVRGQDAAPAPPPQTLQFERGPDGQIRAAVLK